MLCSLRRDGQLDSSGLCVCVCVGGGGGVISAPVVPHCGLHDVRTHKVHKVMKQMGTRTK